MTDAPGQTGPAPYSLCDYVVHQRVLRALREGVPVELQDTLGLRYGAILRLDQAIWQLHFFTMPQDTANQDLIRNASNNDDNDAHAGLGSSVRYTDPLLTVPLAAAVTTITCTATHLCVQADALGDASAAETRLAVCLRPLSDATSNDCGATSEATQLRAWLTVLHRLQSVAQDGGNETGQSEAPRPYAERDMHQQQQPPQYGLPSMRDAPPTPRAMLRLLTTYQALLRSMAHFARDELCVVQDVLTQHQQQQEEQASSSGVADTTAGRSEQPEAAMTTDCHATARAAANHHQNSNNNNNSNDAPHEERPATMAHRGLTASPLRMTLAHVSTPAEHRYSPTHAPPVRPFAEHAAQDEREGREDNDGTEEDAEEEGRHAGRGQRGFAALVPHDISPHRPIDLYAQDDMLTPLATHSSNRMATTPTAALAAAAAANSRPSSSYAFGGFSHIVYPPLLSSPQSSPPHPHRASHPSAYHHSHYASHGGLCHYPPPPRTYSVPESVSSTRSSPAHPHARPASAWSTRHCWSAYSRSTPHSRPTAAHFNNSGSLGHLGPTRGDEMALRVYQQIHGKPYRSAANSLSTLTTATTMTTMAAGAEEDYCSNNNEDENEAAEVEMGSAAELPELSRAVCDESAAPHTRPSGHLQDGE